MATITGSIVDITTRSVNTKSGPGKVYTVELSDGNKYNCGFKAVTLPKGTVVTFEAEKNTYGWQATSHPKPADGASPAEARKASGGYSRGTFPIPLLDGQRSIIRQNALTNARELYQTFTQEPSASFEDAADRIISIARIFESYSAGDIEAQEAEKLLTTSGAVAPSSKE